MITRLVAAVALAGSLLFAPALTEQANAGHGGGGHGGGGHGGGGHFGGGGHLVEATVATGWPHGRRPLRPLWWRPRWPHRWPHGRRPLRSPRWSRLAWRRWSSRCLEWWPSDLARQQLAWQTGMATITTTSSITTASTITTTTSWLLELEDGGQDTDTDMAIVVAPGCITRR